MEGGLFTYYVVKSYSRSPRGALVEEDPVEVPGPEQAVRLAERLSETRAGALAFSKRGSLETGEYEDAYILAAFGHVPGEDDVALLAC